MRRAKELFSFGAIICYFGLILTYFRQNLAKLSIIYDKILLEKVFVVTPASGSYDIYVYEAYL